MAKQLLNEAERFLLEHWGEARLLEESMKTVRTKYEELFQRIIDAVTEAHPELNANACHLTQSWTDGQIGFGRKSWPGGEDKKAPSGLWVLNLRLEQLAAEDSEPPSAFIWVTKKSNLDFDTARATFKQSAKELLTPEELKSTVEEASDEHLLYLPAPSKSELLGGLSDGDGHRLVELFVSQFDLMARFVPVLDKVLHEHLRKDNGA